MNSDRYPLVGEFSIEIDTIPVKASIVLWETALDENFVYHIEFRAQDAAPTPISETGYRSHFVIFRTQQEPSDLEQYARDYVASRLVDRNTDQMELF